MTDQTPSAADVLMFAAQMHGVDALTLRAALEAQSHSAHQAALGHQISADAYAVLAIQPDQYDTPEALMMEIGRVLSGVQDLIAYGLLFGAIYGPKLARVVSLSPVVIEPPYGFPQLFACDFDEVRRQVAEFGLAGCADPPPDTERNRGLVDDSAVPYALLLIPTEADPLKLLGDPESVAWRCGGRPPVAHRMNVGPLLPKDAPEDWRWIAGARPPDTEGPDADEPRHAGYRHALPLIWEGEPIADGIDRAAGCFEAYLDDGPWHRSYPATRATAVNLAHNLCDPDHANAATMVRLDAQGQEQPR